MLQTQAQIQIHHLSYAVPNDKPIFRDVNLTLATKKIGLIGRNGIGKSTLLKLIMGELVPDKGSIHVIGELAYCPQKFNINTHASITTVLNIDDKLQALANINAGSILEEDFKILANDWFVAERTEQQLARFKLFYPLNTKVDALSGGELTRLHLTKTFLADADFILLDEPTNNLDIEARHYLYDVISQWDKGLIIISHDRSLLNLMDEMIEITSLGINSYRGNYDHYLEQKKLQTEARLHDLADAKKMLTRSHRSVQASKEKREHKKARGIKQRRDEKIDKMAANSKRGRSEKTQKRLLTQSAILLGKAQEKVELAKANIEINENLNVRLPDTSIANGKILLDLENVTFCYPHQSAPIIDHFNMTITGPERIALMGMNGSGKTTLIKLILNKLTPTHGEIKCGANYIGYLDQSVAMLNEDLSILDNFLQLHPSAKLIDAHAALAKFLFRNSAANTIVKNLSGGEKIRAGLACTLLAKCPPQLLILDEPTNHLDIESIISIETALACYEGAMIVISHDMSFLKNVNATRFIYAPFRSK